MSTTKTAAQVRGDILADIEAVRLGKMPKETALVLFAGYREVNASISAEVNLFLAVLKGRAVGVQFAHDVRFGKREINGEDDAAAV